MAPSAFQAKLKADKYDQLRQRHRELALENQMAVEQIAVLRLKCIDLQVPGGVGKSPSPNPAFHATFSPSLSNTPVRAAVSSTRRGMRIFWVAVFIGRFDSCCGLFFRDRGPGCLFFIGLWKAPTAPRVFFCACG